jgi:hypothetical protein
MTKKDFEIIEEDKDKLKKITEKIFYNFDYAIEYDKYGPLENFFISDLINSIKSAWTGFKTNFPNLEKANDLIEKANEEMLKIGGLLGDELKAKIEIICKHFEFFGFSSEKKVLRKLLNSIASLLSSLSSVIGKEYFEAFKELTEILLNSISD